MVTVDRFAKGMTFDEYVPLRHPARFSLLRSVGAGISEITSGLQQRMLTGVA